MLHPSTPGAACRRFIALALLALLASGSPAEAARILNKPPVISGTPATTTAVGTGYVFQPVAYDPEGRSLTFKISNRPAWATFNTATGRLSGTPAAAGTFTSIRITASDGRSSVSLAPFSIAVTAPVTNRAPIITGTAVTTAEVGRPYAFQPVATDPDGDPLVYGISGQPSWATFDKSGGTLYGTPGPTHVGTYASVVITVSDGKASTTLAAFTINVAAAPTRSVTLRWTPPTMNTDGSALTNLAGYAVSYGTASRQYSTTFNLPGAGASSVVVEDLVPGTYYFSVKSVNSAGVESEFSNEAVTSL